VRSVKENKLMSEAKEEAIELIKGLPESATWDDIMYEMYVKQKLAMSLREIAEGRLIDHEDIKKEFMPE
jgi:hypothetical protein